MTTKIDPVYSAFSRAYASLIIKRSLPAVIFGDTVAQSDHHFAHIF